MRLIDADELLNDIEDVIDIENDGQDVKKSKLIILGLKIAKKYIKKACTIEAEPVKHGRWSPSGGYVTTAYGTKRCQICSACGVDLLEDDGVYNFCPNCGARMDGDSE